MNILMLAEKKNVFELRLFWELFSQDEISNICHFFILPDENT